MSPGPSAEQRNKNRQQLQVLLYLRPAYSMYSRLCTKVVYWFVISYGKITTIF